MTNEEAIRNLDAMWKMLTMAYDDIADSYAVAYTMAADALKAQDVQNTNVGDNGDTIYRQVIFDTVAEYEKQLCEILGDENELVKVVKILKHRLMALPSTQPDRSLWFRIGEICVDESKGFISAGRAIEKILELLREAQR